MRMVLGVVLAWVSLASSAEHAGGSVPIRIVDGNAMATAAVGETIFEVVIDTGGFGEIGIASPTLSTIQVVFTGDTVDRTDASGTTFESRMFRLPSLKLGEVHLGDILGFERVSASSGIAGGPPITVVGRGLLQRFSVLVDYSGGEVQLQSLGARDPRCGTEWLPFERNEDDHAVILANTEVGPVRALIDTGATYSFLQSALAREKALRVVDEAYSTSSLVIGGQDFGPIELVVLPLAGAEEIDVFLGWNFFADKLVCFDYLRKAVAIRANS